MIEAQESDYVFQFKVAGIQIQKFPVDAGEISIETRTVGEDGVVHAVDWGRSETSFTAAGIVTGNIVVRDPIMYEANSTYSLNLTIDVTVPEDGRIDVYIPEPIQIIEDRIAEESTCNIASCICNSTYLTEERTLQFRFNKTLPTGTEYEF